LAGFAWNFKKSALLYGSLSEGIHAGLSKLSPGNRPHVGTLEDLKSPEPITQPATCEGTCGKSTILLAQQLAQETQKPANYEPPEASALDPGLASVIDRWTALPEHFRQTILTLIQTAGLGDRHKD